MTTMTMTPTTNDRDPVPCATSCKDCGDPGGYTHPRTGRLWRARGLCLACYARRRYHAPDSLRDFPTLDLLRAHAAPLPAVVTPAMIGITPGEIGKHYFTAQALLRADEAACFLAGALWRQRHPEQFGTANLRRLFGDDLAASFWAGSATAERAA